VLCIAIREFPIRQKIIYIRFNSVHARKSVRIDWSYSIFRFDSTFSNSWPLLFNVQQVISKDRIPLRELYSWKPRLPTGCEQVRNFGGVANKLSTCSFYHSILCRHRIEYSGWQCDEQHFSKFRYRKLII